MASGETYDVSVLEVNGNSYSLRDDSKQETLVSGTNIRTINGVSLLGSGNISIQLADDSLVERQLFQLQGAVYDSSTGLYSLNGITDITSEQMRVIWRETHGYYPQVGGTMHFRLGYTKARTNFMVGERRYAPLFKTYSKTDAIAAFAYTSLETIYLCTYDDTLLSYGFNLGTSCDSFMSDNPYLKRVIGIIGMSYVTSCYQPFRRNPNLEDIKLYGVGIDLGFNESPNLSLESLRFLVEYKKEDVTINITLHENAWNEVMADEDLPFHTDVNFLLAGGSGFANGKLTVTGGGSNPVTSISAGYDLGLESVTINGDAAMSYSKGNLTVTYTQDGD